MFHYLHVRKKEQLKNLRRVLNVHVIRDFFLFQDSDFLYGARIRNVIIEDLTMVDEGWIGG